MTIHSVVIQKLLSTNAQLGRHIAAHHFKIYTHGTRNGLTIIDSDKTLISLRNACDFISSLIRLDARFLFVNTNPLFDQIIDQMARKIGVKNDNSWKLGGFLTNSTSPKKFKSRNKKMILGSVHPPDCVVIMDTMRKSSVVMEADRLQIPIVGLVDSSMPWEVYRRITYPIPANDSVQFVYLFCNLITKTFLYEQKKLGKDASRVTKGEETQQIEDTKTKLDEIFVVPYESLVPLSDDPMEMKEILDKLVVVKNNVNMDAEMGLGGPKSVVEVCSGLTCLDLIVNRIESVNSKYGCNIPLVLINSENTHAATMKVLENHANKSIVTLIQKPNLGEKDSVARPYHGDSDEDSSDNEDNENAPSPLDQHEVLLSLVSSGKLDVLLSQGKEYILLLNTDNLADVVEPKILNHLIQENIEYCMEVMPTSLPSMEENALPPCKSKYKLREIARMQGKQLREITRMQDKEIDEKAKLADSTNLWLDMKAISRVVARGASDKWKYPTLKYFNGAIGLKVPESRSLPVESTSDLLLFQSNLFTWSEGILTRNESRSNASLPSVKLGPEFDKVSDFRMRFKSIPNMIDLDSLNVTGDVWFGSGIILKGDVSITARPGVRLVIPDGAVLENQTITRQKDL